MYLFSLNIRIYWLQAYPTWSRRHACNEVHLYEEADTDFKEANIHHLVYVILSPILESFILRTGRENVRLLSEKEIVSKDGETGGEEEFAIVDLIQVRSEDFILIVEAKRASLGQAMKQCFLAMKVCVIIMVGVKYLVLLRQGDTGEWLNTMVRHLR
ncbi:hypothetical protein L211DRAFT_776716 [Terfezia boudieri ATCC MYA-4762]|uniref:Uncharacterized protein n=1 Tax=Terfezia boudieri ATCC MYA-4762 TaxID=1051890 RepID=A0A3N4MLG0_9PEZI|nr:hypothetical protein L211DRAFT_776716 [Terfezia boudieri ATCC MYA-4762]